MGKSQADKLREALDKADRDKAERENAAMLKVTLAAVDAQKGKIDPVLREQAEGLINDAGL